MESEVEQLQAQSALLMSLKEGKMKYRDALLEHMRCLEGKVEAVGRLREVAVQKGEEVEAERREIVKKCALALGKRVQPAPQRRIPAIEGAKEELKLLKVREEAQSKVQQARKCHFCSHN